MSGTIQVIKHSRSSRHKFSGGTGSDVLHKEKSSIHCMEKMVGFVLSFFNFMSRKLISSAKLSGRASACRIHFSFQGAEWFMYNRTAAYDNILTQLEKATQSLSRTSSYFRFFRRFYKQSQWITFIYISLQLHIAILDVSSQVYPSRSHITFRMPSFFVKSLTWLRNQMPSFEGKDLLPLGIDIQRGVILIGNPSTPNLLVAEFQNAFGTYGIVPVSFAHW